METWAGSLKQDRAIAEKLESRLEFLAGQANMLVIPGKPEKEITTRDKFVMIGALHAALNITAEQKKFAQELGWIERKPERIEGLIQLQMPFEASPEIKAAYLKSFEQQKAEKDAASKAQA